MAVSYILNRTESGFGYDLKITKEFSLKCFKCGKKLETPFFFCRQKEVSICRYCELNPETAHNICHSIEVEHEHHNIVRFKIED